MIEQALAGLPPVKRFSGAVLRDLGIPAAAMTLDQLSDAFRLPRNRTRAQGHEDPRAELQGYAWRLWDYWERHLDPDLFVDHSLSGKVRGQAPY